MGVWSGHSWWYYFGLSWPVEVNKQLGGQAPDTLGQIIGTTVTIGTRAGNYAGITVPVY